LTAALHARLVEATETELARRRDLVERRAAAARDTHGDLRLEHVYLLPERAPDDLVIVDCIEFDDLLRHADPAADVAFLLMDMRYAGRDDLARALEAAYVEASGDAGMRAVLGLYTSYRHVVRGKVRTIQATEPEVPQHARQEAVERARRHFLMALDTISAAARRPCLLLVGGLPGTGKSTLARSLETSSGFERLSSDETRKRLAGLHPTQRAAAAFERGLYSPEWTERTYSVLLARADAMLLEGRRVLVDASFGSEARRCAFLDLARSRGVEARLLTCELPAELARERIAARPGGASDATWDVHVDLAARWEPESAGVARVAHRISTQGRPDEVALHAIALLGAEGLA
jgi:hypothetical protein